MAPIAGIGSMTLCRAPVARPFNVTRASDASPKQLRLRSRGPCPAQASSSEEDSEPSTSGRSPAPRQRAPFPFAPVAAIASLGVLETGYLTLTKLTGSEIACPLSGGCASVLSSDFASFWGIIPLSAVGVLAYGAVAALSIAGWKTVKKEDEDAESPLRTAVLAGSLLLGTTSAYLMWILFSAFPGEICPWCIGSATLSGSIVALALSGLQKRELEEAAAPGAGLAAATLLALTLGLGTPDASQAGTGITELEYKQPVVTTESPAEATSLAARLRAVGAEMYGAFWCSHCYEQKQIFGKAAMEEFPYVECFPEGWRQGIDMAPACKAANLEGFPTWVIGSQRLEGAQELATLEKALAKAEAELAAGTATTTGETVEVAVN